MRGAFRQELKKVYVGKIEVLMIQEHHLGEQRLLSYGNLLHGRWQHFWLQAFGPNDIQGGLRIVLSHIWTSHVTMSRSLSIKENNILFFKKERFSGVLLMFMPQLWKQRDLIFGVKFYLKNPSLIIGHLLGTLIC